MGISSLASLSQSRDQGRDTRWYGLVVGPRVAQNLEGGTILTVSNVQNETSIGLLYYYGLLAHDWWDVIKDRTPEPNSR